MAVVIYDGERGLRNVGLEGALVRNEDCKFAGKIGIFARRMGRNVKGSDYCDGWVVSVLNWRASGCSLYRTGLWYCLIFSN